MSEEVVSSKLSTAIENGKIAHDDIFTSKI